MARRLWCVAVLAALAGGGWRVSADQAPAAIGIFSGSGDIGVPSTIGPGSAKDDAAMPLPATYAIDIADRISRKDPNTQARIFSHYPWPGREGGGPRDDLGDGGPLTTQQKTVFSLQAFKSLGRDVILSRRARRLPDRFPQRPLRSHAPRYVVMLAYSLQPPCPQRRGCDPRQCRLKNRILR